MLSGLLLTNPVRPTWKWDFTTGKAPSGATYTGNSGNGTYVNSAGVITASTNNSPRFDYDPATLSPLGYLAEMASTNLCIRSDALDNASWTKTRATVTADAVASPDGTTNADKIVEDTSTNSHYAASATISLTNASYATSVFVKSAGRTACRLEFAGGAGTFGAHFNLATGAVHSVDASTTATIRSFGNGWYRISVQATWPSVSNCNIFIYPANPAGTTSYTGDGSSGIYAWGCQMDSAGVGVTSYIPTAGSTVTRAQDVLSLPLTSLPGWSATQGGVLVAAYRNHTINPTSPGYAQTAVRFDDGSNNNLVRILSVDGSNHFGAQVLSGGAGANSFAGTPAAVFVRRKEAVCWGVNQFADAYDGILNSSSRNALQLPVSPTTIYFGNSSNNQGLNGTLESIAYYRGARSDAFVQAVSR